MKKKAAMILTAALLALAGAAAPLGTAAAEETAGAENSEAAAETSEEETAAEESLVEKGTQIGRDFYEKVDEAIDEADKSSLRKSVREALEQMDEMGISPTAYAENMFGIRTVSAGDRKMPENTLIKDAQNAVQKKTDSFFSMLWDTFLDTLEGMIRTGISVFAGQDAGK